MEARKVAKRVLTRKKKALRQVERHTRQAHWILSLEVQQHTSRALLFWTPMVVLIRANGLGNACIWSTDTRQTSLMREEDDAWW
jgi:hypothetical protein